MPFIYAIGTVLMFASSLVYRYEGYDGIALTFLLLAAVYAYMLWSD